jgi:hypothetical protein
MAESNGKGDRYREVNKKKFDKNWERIFGARNYGCPEWDTCSDICKMCKEKR